MEDGGWKMDVNELSSEIDTSSPAKTLCFPPRNVLPVPLLNGKLTLEQPFSIPLQQPTDGVIIVCYSLQEDVCLHRSKS